MIRTKIPYIKRNTNGFGRTVTHKEIAIASNAIRAGMKQGIRNFINDQPVALQPTHQE